MNKVVNDGMPVIAKRGKSKLISTYNPGGTAERQASFVPEWMKDFLFNPSPGLGAAFGLLGRRGNQIDLKGGSYESKIEY